MSSSSAPPAISHRPGIILVLITLLVYGVLSYLRHSERPMWDEQRYLDYASNLTQGYYVTEAEPDIVNGPAYPILLMPFVGGGADHWLFARLLNAVFMAGAVGFVWLTVRHYANSAWAFAGALITAFHPTLLWMGAALMTEPLSTFTFTGFIWSFTHALRTKRWTWTLLAIVFFGTLILTRVFFGHVLMATAVLCGGLLLVREWRPALMRTLVILAGSLIFCSPYLAYTQSKTGEFLCWSTNSGELLYWMSSHHEGENGHWFGKADVRTKEFLNPVHREFYQELLTHPILEREERLKAAAMANFKAAPAKVAYNWVCNLTRLAFGFPRSHQPEELRTIVLIAFNGPVIVLAAAAGLLGLWFWRSIPVEIWLLMGMAAFYLGGSTLAPSLPRYFVLMVPVLWLGIAHVFSRHVRVSLRD